MGCSSSNPEHSIINDGLMLTYSNTTPYGETIGEYAFRKIGKNRYEVVIKKDGEEVGEVVKEITKEIIDGNFSYVSGIAKNTSLLVVGGGIIWISSVKLSQNTVPDHEVIELTQKNGYEVYKLKYTLVEGCYSYYDKRTGLLVSDEQHTDEGNAYTTLVSTNVEGMK
jgi:hypothetical protein